jgi:hypothetical protein
VQSPGRPEFLHPCFTQIPQVKTFYNSYLYFKTLSLHLSLSKTYPYLNIFYVCAQEIGKHLSEGPTSGPVPRSYRPKGRKSSIDASYVVQLGYGLHISVDRSTDNKSKSPVSVPCRPHKQPFQGLIRPIIIQKQPVRHDITAAKMYAITPVKMSD